MGGKKEKRKQGKNEKRQRELETTVKVTLHLLAVNVQEVMWHISYYQS
jgi:hypothetical protein